MCRLNTGNLEMNLEPFSDSGLLRNFAGNGSSSKHLLTIYSMVVGLNAKTIIDLGVGATTRALRGAAELTGGTVYSVDRSEEHYGEMLAKQTPTWKMFIGMSDDFFASLPADLTFDFVMHDAAHDYARVKRDLEAILPRMKTFGLICIHDTQHSVLGEGMYRAVREATEGKPVTTTTLPYCSGMTIIRTEESAHGRVLGLDAKREGDTQPFPIL